MSKEKHQKIKVMMVNCPHCGASTPWKGNPDRPFCSSRCRSIDLGNWADEKYRVPGDSVPQDEDNTE